MSEITEQKNINQMNQIIAERAYQAIKDITPQIEQDIRNQVRLIYEQELHEHKVALEEKIKQNCQKEIEDRVELMHKQTIEEYKRRKKNIEMKERELEEHRQRIECLIESEIRKKEEQNILVEREKIMTELLQNIDKNQLVNEVENELKKEILKDIQEEKEGEIKRKETILKLNYKKKYENEKVNYEQQILNSCDNILQQELENIQLQRQMIQSQTQEKQNRIQNLQIEKKQQKQMIQVSKDKYQKLIYDLEQDLIQLQRFREQVSREYNTQSLSSTHRRDSSNHTSPKHSSKINNTLYPQSATSPNKQSIANISGGLSGANQKSGRKSIQFLKEEEQGLQQPLSSKVGSPTNRLQNVYNSSQKESSLSNLKSREQSRTQLAQNYLSEYQNTVIDDTTNNVHNKLDTFNPGFSQQNTENDQYQYTQHQSIQQSDPIIEQQKAKEVQERVSNLLGEIQQKYNKNLQNDIKNFIMSAEKNKENKRFQSQPQYLPQQDIYKQNEELNSDAKKAHTYSYKPNTYLLRKDSSETESDQNSPTQIQRNQEKSHINSETLQNFREQYESLKMNNQQQLQGLPTFKTETNSIRYNTIYNDPQYQQNDYTNQYYTSMDTENGKRGNKQIQKNNTSQNKGTSGASGFYTSQEFKFNDENQEEESILNSSTSTVQLQKELRNPERVRPKEIQTEEELINYLLQEKSFPNRKQYNHLWKIRPRDSEEEQKIKNIKLTIDCILEEEKEYESIFEKKVKQFERDLEINIRKFSEESWTEDDTISKEHCIREKFNKLKHFWRICDTSFKERIQTISTFTALSCMLNKMEKQIEDQVEILDIVRNNPVIVKVGQQLKERQKLKEKMINEFCLMNYRNYKEDLRTVYDQINMLNNEFQTTDKKGKKNTISRLSRNKANPKQLFWRNIKLSDILKIDKWEEQKLQQCLIKLKLQGFK